AIGIFDSGIGGLTVAAEVGKALPNEHMVYLGDTARVPYGTKSVRTVERYAVENGRMLLDLGAKLIVVACNTASALAGEHLRDEMPVPVIDVVGPGARAAASVTRTGRIGVIGTRSTIASGAYERAIMTHNGEFQVFSASCPLFVPLAEEGWTDGDVPKAAAEKYLYPLLEQQIDVLVLGCTHYPLLSRTIQDVCGEDVVLVDSAHAAAADVKHLIEREGLGRDGQDGGSRRFFVTDLSDQFTVVAGRFFGSDHIDLTLVDLPWVKGCLADDTA
ncbi:MAG: glutamate racemase, partial [Candidatus Hydrogenedentes bacterium]|nr:glutamate racemase [Candidatus Hydrogenedentota bacterium]